MMDKPVKDWGPGIPRYTKNDVLSGLELHAFCTEIVARSMQDDGYTIEGIVPDRSPTQVIANKNGQRYAVIVAGGVYPYEGHISFGMKTSFSDFCKKQHMVPMFASVGIMSQDEERAAAGLALKYDGYMIKYTGEEDISRVNIPVQSTQEFKAYCVERIIEAYSTGRFDILYDYFADDIQLHSQWVWEPLIGKPALIDYFNGKGKAIRNANIEIGGSVVVITSDQKRSGKIVLMSEPGKLCALIRQELNGEETWIFISPKFNSDIMLCELSLNDPGLFEFKPYYAFE